MYDTTITIRTNNKTKAEAKELFAGLGMDMSTALNIFLKKALNYRGIPFEVADGTLNAETWKVIDEAHKHPETLEGPYTTEAEILKALHA